VNLKKIKSLNVSGKSGSFEHVRRHWRLTILLLFLALVLSIIISISIGYTSIPFTEILQVFINRTPLINGLLNFQVNEIHTTLIMDVRFPRALCGVLVGAALAIAGSAYQGLFRNPMADPYTIGASSGAALGATASVVLGLSMSFFGIKTIPIFAFLGCLFAVLFVYSVSKVGTKIPVQTLLLSGIAVSIFLSAIVGYFQAVYPDETHQSSFWLAGSFSYTEWADVWSVLPFILGGSIVIYLFSRDLNLMALGEDEATHLGVNLERMKKILLVASAFVTAAAVSISGLIAFVGLIIPHLTRLLISPDHRILIPASALMGGVFLVLCDSLGRVIISPSELPVGIITAVCGGPFFLYLMRRKKKVDAA
jgi:iron complex transport system permease protein